MISVTARLQIVEARTLLAHELKNQNTMKPEDLSGKISSDPEENAISHFEEPLSVPSPVSENKCEKAPPLNVGTSTAQPNTEVVKPSVERSEIQMVNKPVIEDKDVDQVKDQYPESQPSSVSGKKDEDEDDDADDWLKEETSGADGAVGNTIPIENEDDVSFSDLEDDDDGDAPTSFRKSNYSSDKDSRDWVQLGKSSSESSKDIDVKHSDKENSNDWLDVDDIVVS